MQGRRVKAFVGRYRWVGALYLTVGAAVSIGVAWTVGDRLSNVASSENAAAAMDMDGLHVVVETSRGPGSVFVMLTSQIDREDGEQTASVYRAYGKIRNLDVGDRVVVPGWARSELRKYATQMSHAAGGRDSVLSVGAVGWPLLCLKAGELSVKGGRPMSFGVLTISPKLGLPYLPVWPGFLADAALYACVPGVLHVGAWAWERRRRRVRGACVSCGYSQSGLAAGAACPECGAET